MDDPQVVNYLRIAYATAQLLSLGIYYYITLQVRFLWAIRCQHPLTVGID